MNLILYVLLVFISSTNVVLQTDSKDHYEPLLQKVFKSDNNRAPDVILPILRENVIDTLFRNKDIKSLGYKRRRNENSKVKHVGEKERIEKLKEKLETDLDGIDINSKRRETLKKIMNDNRRAYMTSRNGYPASRLSSSSTESFSSSAEEVAWKDEWREYWMKKKIEALNATSPKGDTVNMVGARPWGVPCGDPNQHDMPWGSCMLPMECEAEYRIYRGDYFCGPTRFVCCALQLQTYDTNLGFDVSFEDSQFVTDSEENKIREKSSRERKNRQKRKEKRRRRKRRMRRKRKMKRLIKRIVKQMRKILNRNYRNRSRAMQKKTKELKRFIKSLKKKYKKDRGAVKDIHEIEMVKIDALLMAKLHQVRDLNEHLFRNNTFGEIIANGSITRDNLRLLHDKYPDLIPESNVISRRSLDQKRPDYLDYDIEYGYMYY